MDHDDRYYLLTVIAVFDPQGPVFPTGDGAGSLPPRERALKISEAGGLDPYCSVSPGREKKNPIPPA